MRFTLRRVLICGCAALKEKDFPEEEPVGACKNGVRRPSEADKQGGADERAPYSTEESTASEESAGALDSSAGAFGDAIGPLRSVASSATPAHPHGARSASWASRGRTQSLRSGSSSCSGAASARPDARCSAPGSARSPNAMSLVPECGAQSCYYNPLAEDSDGNELCDGDEEGFQSGSDDDSAPLPERRSATALTSDDPAAVSSSISTSGLPSPSPKSSPKPGASPSQLKRLWVPPPPTATQSQPELAPELPSAEPATPEVRSSARGSPFAAAPDAEDSAAADAAELSDGGAPPCLGGGGSVTRPTAPPTPPRVAPAAELDADRGVDLTLLPADAVPLEPLEEGAIEAASEPAPPSPTLRSGCPLPPCCPLSPPAAACTSPVPTSGADGAAADCDCPFRASPSTAAAGLAAASAADDGADDASGADRKTVPAPAAAAGAAFAPETPPLAERQLAGLTSAAEAAAADAEAAAAAAAAAERDGAAAAAAAAAVTAAAEAATAAASAGVAEVEQSMAGGDEVSLEGRMVSLRCRQPDFGSQPIAGTASAEAEAEAGALMEALVEAERLALAEAPAAEARQDAPSPPQPQPAAEEVAEAEEVETELIAWGSGEVSEAAAEAATCSAAASEVAAAAAAAERAPRLDAAAAATAAPAAEAPGPSPAQAAPRRTVPCLAAALSWRSLPPAPALRRSQSTGGMAALALGPGRPCPASAAPAPTAAALRGTASVLRRGTTSTPTYGSLSEAVSYIFMPVLYNDASAYRQSAPTCLTPGTLDSLSQRSILLSAARPTSSAPADGVPVPSILPTTPGQAPPGQGPLPESPSAAVERAEAAEAVAALGGSGLHPHNARLIRPPCACQSDSCDCFLRSRMGTRSWTDGGCGIGLGLGFALAGMDGGSFAISAGGASATASPVGVIRPGSRTAGASGADAGAAATGSAAQGTSEAAAAAAAGAPAEDGESNDPGCSISGLCMTRALIRRLGLAPSTFAGALPQPAAPAPAAPFRPALPTCHEVAPSSPFAAAGSAAAAALLGRDADVAMALAVPESPRPVTWSDSESRSNPMSPGLDPESGSESGSDASDDSLDSVDGPLPMPPTAAELARRQAWRCWQQRAEAAEPHPHPHSLPQPQPQPHAASASTVHGVAGGAVGEAEPEPQLEAWTPLRERWAAMARRKAGGRVASLRALHEKHVRAAAAAGVSKPKPGPGPGPGPGLGLGRSVSGRSRRSRQSDFGHVSGTAAAAAPLRQRTSYHGAGLGLAPRLSATGAAMVAAAATAVRAAAGPEARAAVEPVSEEQPEEACAPVESWRPLRERVAWRRVAGGRA